MINVNVRKESNQINNFLRTLILFVDLIWSLISLSLLVNISFSYFLNYITLYLYLFSDFCYTRLSGVLLLLLIFI